MSKLQELLAQHPEEKEEFDFIFQNLNEFSTNEIKRLLEYIAVLEEMIEKKEDRAEILQTIDAYNGWTKWMRADGYLDEDTEWWETVL